MPYSKQPIQRAISTWLTKAMTALMMRIEEGDQRHAAGFAALVGGEQHRVDPAKQRPYAQRQALRQEPSGCRCRGKAHSNKLRFSASFQPSGLSKTH